MPENKSPNAGRSISFLAPHVSKLNAWAIGVDLGSESLRGAWVHSSGQLHDPIKWETRVEDGKEKVLGRMLQLVEELMKNPPEGVDPEKDCLGAGFGVPGILHLKKGIVVQSPHFPDWKRFAVHEKLRKKLNIPVFVDNDANVAAIGEKIFGACKSYDHFISVVLGRGISGAIFVNGDIYQGSLGMAGEVGHITVDPQGLPEATGNRGSVELYASGYGLQRMIKELTDANPDIQADSPEDLFELYKRGNKYEHFDKIEKIFNEMGDALGVMLANVVNTLDPQAICFAGSLTGAWKAFSRKMIQITMERSFVARHNKLRILCTSLSKNSNFLEAGVVGSASMVFIDQLRRSQEELKASSKTSSSPKLKVVSS
ncbi:MAG: ROK family protein [Bradymonadales bacterium]|nr:MAG: ROK family protein [Bradymonadales bacterium]